MTDNLLNLIAQRPMASRPVCITVTPLEKD